MPLRTGSAGIVVSAGLVAGAWALAGCSDSDPGGRSVGTAALSAPARLGGYSRLADVPLSRQGLGKATADRVHSWNQRSAQRLSRTYGGAAAVVETYADDRLGTQFSLVAARASTPFPPFVPYQDPAVLGLSRPPEDLVSIGDVACVVRNDATVAGQTPAADATHVVSCVRTGPTLTVQAQNLTGDLGQQPTQVAHLLDEAWSALS